VTAHSRGNLTHPSIVQRSPASRDKTPTPTFPRSPQITRETISITGFVRTLSTLPTGTLPGSGVSESVVSICVCPACAILIRLRRLCWIDRARLSQL
jgi:hypothetical protein